MKDLFDPMKRPTSLVMSEELLQRVLSWEDSPVKQSTIAKYKSIITHFLNFEYCRDYAEACEMRIRLLKFFPEFKELVDKHLKCYSSENSVFYCEACGEELPDGINNHKCKDSPRDKIMRRGRKHSDRQPSLDRRLRDGFEMINEP